MILFLYFAVGVAVGVAAAITWVAFVTTDDVAVLVGAPSRFTHYRGGYHEGHADGKVGIWRGGPLP